MSVFLYPFLTRDVSQEGSPPVLIMTILCSRQRAEVLVEIPDVRDWESQRGSSGFLPIGYCLVSSEIQILGDRSCLWLLTGAP